MRESFNLTIGAHTVRVQQLATEDATTGMDALIHVFGEAALRALFSAFKGGGGAESLLDTELKLVWPASDAGLTHIRALYLASATLKSGTTPDGKDLYLPLKACTETVFDGHPGYLLRFHALCTAVNYKDFFHDALEGGFTFHKV